MPQIPGAGGVARLIPWLILLGSIAIQLVAFDTRITVYDEGIILVGAEQVSRGELPYRDFWTMYGPGQFYVVSWLFSAFGPSDLVVRAYGIAVKASIVSLAYVTIARLAPRWIGVAGALVILGVLLQARQDTFPLFPALALSLGAMLLLERGLRASRTALFAAGCCTGLAAAFRHDLGAYGAVAIGLGVLLARLAGPATTRHGRALLNVLGQMGWYALGVILVMGPIAVALLSAVPIADLYENLFHIPTAIYPRVRALPFPGLEALRVALLHPRSITQFAVYVPVIVGLLALVAWAARPGVLNRSGRPTSSTAADVLIPVLALTCLLFTLKGVVRVSTLHMTQALVISVVLICICASRAAMSAGQGRRLQLFLWLPAAGLLAAVAGNGAVLFVNGLAGVAGLTRGDLIARCIQPELPRTRCVTVDPDYLRAARFIRERSQDDEAIYVGTTRHDKLHSNAIEFYFIADRKPATKWYELHPGVQTQARIQDEMIADLTKAAPRFAILDSRWDDLMEPNDSSVSSGERRLDDFLWSRYEEVQRYGSVHVLVRK